MKRPPFFGARLRPKAALLSLALCFGAASPWALEWALHRYVERTASALNGAEVSIGNFQLSLLQGRAVLGAIQVTQHTEPRFNLFEIEKIQFSFKRSALFSLKLQIPEMQVTGLRLRTQRERSGALPSDLPNNPTPLVDRVRPDPALLKPGTVKASPLRFIAALSQNREAPLVEDAVRRTSAAREIASFADHVQTRYAQWAIALASLVAAEKNPTPYLIQRRVEQLHELQEQVLKETDQLRLAHRTIRETLEDRGAEALARSGISSGDDPDLSEALFGNRFAGHVERLSYWIEASRRRISFGPALGSLAETPQDPVISIEEITFVPSTHRKAASLTGTIQHFSTFPVGKESPLVASLKAEWGKGSTAVLELRVDHTGPTPSETLSLRASNLELTQWQIESSPDVRLALSSPRSGLSFETNASEKGVEAQGALEVEEPKFLVNSKSKILETTVMKALSASSERFHLTASLRNQALRVQSSFGTPLAEALRAEFGPAMKARYDLAAQDLSTKANKALLLAEQALESHSLKMKTQAQQGIAQWRALQRAG